MNSSAPSAHPAPAEAALPQATPAQRLDQEIRHIELAANTDETAQLGEALKQAIQLVHKLSGRSSLSDGEYIGLLNNQPNLIRPFATRIAAVIAQILLAPKFKLNPDLLHQLMISRVDINDVFRVSGFAGTIHARNILIDREQRKASDGSGGMGGLNNIYRSIVLATLDDIYPEQLKYLISVAGADEALMILSLLDERAVFSVRGDEYRNVLLQEKRAFAALPLEEPYSLLVSHVWMFCSYATSPRKHEIKLYLNDWFKRLLEKKGIRFSKQHVRKSIGKKKNMVMVAEAFKSGHAMYRWYAPIVRELKKNYRLIMVGRKIDVDEVAIGLFDQFVEVKNEISGLQEVLNSCRPDVVFYPSLGMRAWSIALSNIRWAPLQIMMLGHPATSHVETIDAVITQKNVVSTPTCFAENVLALDSSAGNIIDANTQALPQRRSQARSPNHISVAVPCVSMKINPVFMTMLQEIQKASGKLIQYTFFPNELGIPMRAITTRIREWLPTARVVPRMDYANYLAHLVEHDIALSPFPFGNASSLIDCLLVGLPTVTWRGVEPHSLTDFVVVDACDLTDDCCTSSMSEYLDRAVKLINDVDYRESVRKKIQDGRIAKIHNAEERPFVMECVAAIRWAEANAKTLSTSRGNIYFRQDNWEALDSSQSPASGSQA